MRLVLILLPMLTFRVAAALEPDQVYAKVAPSIVVVVAYKSGQSERSSFGSGVVISPGQVITNCHVIEGADVIRLVRDKQTTVGIIRYSDPERDLCQIGATDASSFSRAVTHIVSTSGLRVGQKVYAIGAPQGLELTLSDGLISSLRALPEGTIIQTTAPISPGSSGGGLFDSDGRLIGITSFLHKNGQNLNFAIPAAWINDLASRHQAREEALVAQLEEEARKAEERKQAEEPRRVEEAKRDEERKQKPAGTERERRAQEAARRQRESEETRRKPEANARTAQQRAIDDWRARIQSKIRGRIVVPSNIEGNPEARFEVVLLPGGEVLSALLKKSSGNPAYDAAIERAISAASPFPVPSDTDLFQESFRELTLVFRPKGDSFDWAEATGTDKRQDVASRAQPFLSQEAKKRYQETIQRTMHRVEYPALAKRRHWEGVSTLFLTISKDGTLLNVSVAATSGYIELDDAAVKAVYVSSPFPPFSPEMRDQTFTFLMPVKFNLE